MEHPTPEPSALGERLTLLRRRIDAACTVAGRRPEEVRLLLASKGVDAEVVREAANQGATLLGENRVQELAAKAPRLQGLGIEWHMIGHLQSNKVRQALEWARLIQSVDRPSLLGALEREAARRGEDVEVLMQVNTSGEATKSGVRPEEARAFAHRIASTPGVRLRGLMTIALHAADPEGARPCFRLLRNLRDELEAEGLGPLPVLSMGMSGDLEVAIEEGSTLIRVGTAIFGARPPSAPGGAR
jgi:pyridoxal phosphate enzyme (YggS family)